MPGDLLFEMFLQVLPPEVEKEIKRTKDISDHHEAYAYVVAEQGRLNNERLAKVHEQRRDRELGQKTSNGFGPCTHSRHAWVL